MRMNRRAVAAIGAAALVTSGCGGAPDEGGAEAVEAAPVLEESEAHSSDDALDEADTTSPVDEETASSDDEEPFGTIAVAGAEYGILEDVWCDHKAGTVNVGGNNGIGEIEVARTGAGDTHVITWQENGSDEEWFAGEYGNIIKRGPVEVTVDESVGSIRVVAPNAQATPSFEAGEIVLYLQGCSMR